MQTFKDKNILRHPAVSTVYLDYPAPIKHTTLLRSKEDDKKIIDFFLNLKDQGTPDRLSNVTGWKSDWKSHILYHEVLDDLFREIVEFHNNYFVGPRNSEEVPDFVKQSGNYNIDAEVWFAEYLPGDSADEHNHTWSSRSSFVYYLDVEEGGSPLTFVQKNWRNHGAIDTVREIDLQVHQGTLVLFPSFLDHKVKATNSKRYLIAGNINDITYIE
jgi:hypothetical protein